MTRYNAVRYSTVASVVLTVLDRCTFGCGVVGCDVEPDVGILTSVVKNLTISNRILSKCRSTEFESNFFKKPIFFFQNRDLIDKPVKLIHNWIERFIFLIQKNLSSEIWTIYFLIDFKRPYSCNTKIQSNKKNQTKK